jgi:exonuclease III
LKFGTWNVEGCRNKMEEIMREINVMCMDVVVLTEVKNNGTGNETLRNYIQFFNGVKKCEMFKRGVSVFKNKKWKSSIKISETIDERF